MAAKGFREAQRATERLARLLPQAMNQIKQDSALRFIQYVIPATPVDTGTAQGNYLTSLGAAVFAFTLLEGGAANGQAAVTRGIAILRSSIPGQPIYITNSTEYLADLDHGSSPQSEGGFIDRAATFSRIPEPQIRATLNRLFAGGQA